MNVLDVAVLGLILVLAIRGLFRGFFREFFGLLAWIGGGVAGHVLAPVYAPVASQHTGLPIVLGQVIAFAVVFVLVYVLCRIVGFGLARAAAVLFLRPLDRFGGLVFGAAKGIAIAAIFCMLFTSRRGAPTLTEQVKESPELTNLVERSWDLVGAFRTSLGLDAAWEAVPYSKLEEEARKALMGHPEPAAKSKPPDEAKRTPEAKP